MDKKAIRRTCRILGVAVCISVIQFSCETIMAGQKDPEGIMGPKKCSKCHSAEFKVWENTPHHKTFKTMHRRKKAKMITKKLNIESTKRDSLCVTCHYTIQKKDNHNAAISGISCESCHGAAKKWIETHHVYGGPKGDKENETKKHREKRLAEATANGMI